MNVKLLFSRDTRHLRILAVLLIAGGAGGAMVRNAVVPASYGELGPFRREGIEINASRPKILQSPDTCLSCHEYVGEERAESPHKAVACFHCHGIGREHVKHARLAEESSDHEIPSAVEWDGDFWTEADLFITQDKASCLSCHMRVVGMPKDFLSINVAEHLEEQGASEPESRDSCFECHSGHDPGL